MMNLQKTLLFDLVATQPNVTGKRHGGGRYGEIIFFRIASRKLPMACFYDSRKWLNPDVKKVIDEMNYSLYDIAQYSIDEIVAKSGAKRLYSCLSNPLLYNMKGIEVITTLHGMRELETPVDNFFLKYKQSLRSKVRFYVQRFFPDWWKNRMKKKYERIIHSGAKIITVSNHSQAAIRSYFPEYNFVPEVFFSPNTSSEHPAMKKPSSEKYFLMVSGNRWEKNNLRAIIAFDKLISAGLLKDIKAVVTGCNPNMFHYKIQNPEAFKFYGYVDDNVLEELYANAYIFVYPSLNEGFGYPPLEAMRYGVPVIASPFSSISEVLEGAALYYNPFSVEEIMSRMLLMMDSARHEEYASLGKLRYQKIKARQDTDLDMLIDRLYYELSI